MYLNNNLEIPEIAFGTGVVKRFYRNKKLYFKDNFIAIMVSIKHGRLIRRLNNDLNINKYIQFAINNGYRLIDTGRLYGHSELCIGKSIKKFDREKLFIVTKVSDVDLKRYDTVKSVADCLKQSLINLETNYVDALLLHFPVENYLSLYQEMEYEYRNGKAKAIGVCNFDESELLELIELSEIKPMICQVEMHPLNTKKGLLELCKCEGIVVMAHTPTAHMNKKITESEIITKLMSKYEKNTAQIIYRWHLQNGVIPIVSSVSPIHIYESININDFELTQEEMEEIDALNMDYSCDLNNNKINDCPDFIYNL